MNPYLDTYTDIKDPVCLKTNKTAGYGGVCIESAQRSWPQERYILSSSRPGTDVFCDDLN